MLTPEYLEDWIEPGQRNTKAVLRDALARLGHPERAVPVVLVGGTNGKGSTVAFLEAVCRAAGHHVATFTSPALFDFHEQIRVDGKPLDPEQGRTLASQVRSASPAPLTLFETQTAMAYLAFQEARPDIALVEVGMGGTHDATNLCDPIVSILTSVGLDHVRELGGSLQAITEEKAGIARAGRPLIVGVDPVVRALLDEQTTRGAHPVDALNEHFSMIRRAGVLCFESPGLRLEGLHLGLPGRHQEDNAALAVQAARRLADLGFDIPSRAIRKGLRRTRIRGRLEWLEHPRGYRFLVDGGHNPHAASAIARSLEESPTKGPRWMGVAIFADKDVEGFLAPLLPVVDHLICSRSSSPRCLEPEDLRQAALAVAERVLPDGAPLPELSVVPAVSDVVAVFEHNKEGTNILCGSFSVVQEAEQAVGEALGPLPRSQQ